MASKPVKSGLGNAVAIVQARLGSVRMPGKVLMETLDKPLLQHLLERLARSESISAIVLAIPSSSVNDRLEEFAERVGVSCVRGSEIDVLDRFVAAARIFPAAAYVRVTGDCPLVDPEVVDAVVRRFYAVDADYGRTAPSFPDGLDVEVFRSEKLFEAADGARLNYDREHVTPYIRRTSQNNSFELEAHTRMPSIRLTVDEPEDFAVIDSIFRNFRDNRFSLAEVVALESTNPNLFSANNHFLRDAGSKLGTGEKLWTRAKRVIPGGNHLLSKRAEMHLAGGWPTYFSKTSGCEVWDLDGRHYWDLGYMGIGTNILGYSHPAVDEAVKEVVAAGNLSTLNCAEEVYLAEKLCEIHNWADMARFTRSGGEAASVAVRIARAASGKDAIAICGYHGWHDWYLSANLADDSALDGHLLRGLSPAGVPRNLAGLVRPFTYNSLTELQAILDSGDVGTIFMEVERSTPPEKGFLEGVRGLADKYGAVLVFDECTSGFRRVLGGLHLYYGVEPDIALFGKTLGNGYAINAVIGRKSVMEAAQSTFISSTFWSERIGPAAAIATLKVMEAEDSPSRVNAIGERVRLEWQNSASEIGIDLEISGLPALSLFSLGAYDANEVKTFFTQELLAAGFLGANVLYASQSHSPEILSSFFETWSGVLANVHAYEPGDLKLALKDGPAQTGFQRLN